MKFMHRTWQVAVLTTGLLGFSPSAWSQALNGCDLNTDQAVNTIDVQLSVNMALGATGCTATIEGTGVCNVVVVQRVVNAALGGTCRTVILNWGASPSSGVAGYRVLRGTASGGPYTLVNTTALITGTTYRDSTVVGGQTYYYVVAAVDGSNNQSANSNQVQVLVPNP
ncbi:MAG: hypothetical protein ACKV22_40210 [Bryobacteraceae bacterium]